MVELNLPHYTYKLKQSQDSVLIWDDVRKKYVTLTPEEWVRQHFVAFLVNHRGVPQGRIGNEISLLLNGRSRRCDTLVYNEMGEPLILIEYKAPHIAITQQTFDQIVRYNMVFQVPYLIVSNGITHYCCHINYLKRQYTFIQDIPHYTTL